MSESSMQELIGVTEFYSETGTEGGYWAFQDERFIKPNTTRFWCKHCYLNWTKNTESEEDVLRKGEERRVSASGMPYCERIKHDFVPISPEDWSYEGLYLLKNDDYLTIFDREKTKVLWSGTIHLKHYPPFQEDAFGWRIHDDQIGVDREVWAKWFMEKHPAKLITKQRR
jgi:hypothetical protein